MNVGGSRYQPGSDSVGGAGYSDPFTGSGAYRPGQSSASGAGGSDPYTGMHRTERSKFPSNVYILGGGYSAGASAKVRSPVPYPSLTD